MLEFFTSLFSKKKPKITQNDNSTIYPIYNTKMYEYMSPNLCLICKEEFKFFSTIHINYTLKCNKCKNVWHSCKICGTPNKTIIDKMGIIENKKFICWDCYIV